jgi:hypothetical protein
MYLTGGSTDAAEFPPAFAACGFYTCLVLLPD